MKKIYGATGSYPEYFTAKNVEPPALVITESRKRAALFAHDLKAYLDYVGKKTPVIEIPSEIDPLDLEAQIKVNFALASVLSGEDIFIVGTPKSLNLPVPGKESILSGILRINRGGEIDREKIIHTLVENGYIRVDRVENEGEFSVKGGFITVYIPFTGITEIDLFGDYVESINIRSLLGTRKAVDGILIFPLKIDHNQTDSTFGEYTGDIRKIYVNLPGTDDVDIVFTKAGTNPGITSGVSDGFKTVHLPLRQPLVLKSERTAFLPEGDFSFQPEFEPIEEGDYIIHQDYGMGIYRGIQTRQIKGKTYDFMILEYAGGEKIYVSYLHFDRIFKYRASGIITVDSIGGTSWRNLKRKVKNSLKKVARELIKLYTERQNIKREPYQIDMELMAEFENSFEFVETPDQLKAINDIKKDMQSDRPMERVVCGDVGFGKTEVALRGVFIAVMNGKQVAVLTPTTVLSYQHYRNFKRRLEPFGIRVENLSRLKSRKEIEAILQKLENGEIDVVIGTHRLLQGDVRFKNLGLLVIDEEHRFGVRAKEKIRQLKKDVDTIYMTATPIPRTLSMALSGLKDLSVIKTPPEGRVETRTFVSPYREEIVKTAIERELARNGQVFYLHNRIQTIEKKARQISQMFPGASVAVAHGRMKPKQIEKVILDFIEGKTDILVSTSIIETGIDIPTANTLIIENAELFGLAQLYHLRGRVGRGNQQAYCYLLVGDSISEKAEKRLDTIMRLTRPGSGLKISVEDMRIRGAGNILGVEQSGHIKAVGYELYLKLLQEVLNEERGLSSDDVTVIVRGDSFIPENFIKDPHERMNVYMTVSKAQTPDEIDEIKKYLSQFYSGLPEAFNRYLDVEKLRRAARGTGITRIEIDGTRAVLYFEEGSIQPEVLHRLISQFNAESVTSNSITISLPSEEIEKLASLLENRDRETVGI
ncbi:transcription-repair coupling factor [Persephonella sp.]